MPHTDVIMFSGGLGSWAAGKLRRQEFPEHRAVCLFADTKFEDADLYRFLPEAAANVGAELVMTAEGRDIWQVFKDGKYLANSRVDPCSRLLKREWLRAYIDAHFEPVSTTIVVGYGAEEGSRVKKAASYWEPWRVAYPLNARPDLTGPELAKWCEREGMDPPRLYDLGFEHNNCKGGCVKAGISNFVHLYRTLPDAFAEWEQGEAETRAVIGKNVSILTDRRNGDKIPLTLATLRQRIDAGESFPRANRFACGCFATEDGTPEPACPVPSSNAATG